MNSAVFLDRDNTIIHNDGDLGDPAQVRLIQGAASAIASIKGLGFRVIVVTNQGGVARGKYGEADVDAVNNRINEIIKNVSGVGIDRFYYCPFHPQGTVEKYRREHPWRKPQPGMLLQAAQDADLDLGQCWMVGDQQRDSDAGAAAGVRTILLTPDAEELSPLKLEQIAKDHERRLREGGMSSPLFTARNLVEAVRIIAQQRRPEIAAEAARNREGKRWDAQSVRAVKQSVTAEPPVAGSSVVQPPAASPVVPLHSTVTPVPPAPPVSPVLPVQHEAVAVIKTPPPAPAPVPAAPPAPSAIIEPAPQVVTAKDAAPILDERLTPDTVPPPAKPRRALTDADEYAREDETLRQILQEVRNYRAHAGDFSYTKFLAVVLQMLAVCLFVGALWMGGESDSAYLRWAGASLFMQLTVIAALLFNK